MSAKQSNRRRFLKKGVAIAGVAAAGTGVNYQAGAQTAAMAERRPDEWYDYGVRSEYVTSKRTGTNGRYGRDPRPGLVRWRGHSQS